MTIRVTTIFFISNTMVVIVVVIAGLLCLVSYLSPVSNERRHENCYLFLVVSFFMSFGPSLKHGIISLIEDDVDGLGEKLMN